MAIVAAAVPLAVLQTNSRAARRPRAVAMRPIMGKLAEKANCVIDL